MIIVYPMLTSETVSHNVLPGICKALERFIITYRLEDEIKGSLFKDIAIKFVPLGVFQVLLKAALEAMKEGVDISDNIFLEENNIIRPGIGSNPGQKPQASKGTKIGGGFLPDDIEVTYTPGASKASSPTKVEYPNRSDIMLEPTYITAQTKNGPTLIGIKVIPFPLKTSGNQSASDLINKDLERAYAMAVGMKRSIIRNLWLGFNNTIANLPIIGPFLKRTVTGDPMKDIIYASTKFKDKTFVCFDSMDIQNSFTSSASTVKKIQNLGWGSFIIADNVNKRANFCMKEFGGMCNILPYSYLFSSLSKDQKQSYTDLEDIKKSSSAFFRRKVPKRKVFGEQLAKARFDKMNEKNDFFLDESELLNEGILDFAKTRGKKIIEDIKRAISTKKPEQLSKVLDTIPDVNLSKIQNFSKKQNPEFQKSYTYAKRVIDNSLPNVNDDIKDHLATGIAIKASTREGDVIQNTKDDLKRDMPAIMRAIGSTAGTAGWVILWYYVSQIIFSFSNPVTVVVTMLLIARGIYKHAKKERKIDEKEREHQRKLEKMAKDIEKEKAKSMKGPLVNIQKSSNEE